VGDPALHVDALLLAQDHDAPAPEAAEPADDGAVLAEVAVAGQRCEVLDQAGHVVLHVRPVRMARHLGLLPGRQLGVGLAQQPLGLALQARDFLRDVDVIVVREVAQLLDLALELGDRLFKIQKIGHSCPAGFGASLAQAPGSGDG